MAVRVFHHETQVPVEAWTQRLRDLDAAVRQVVPQLLAVAGLKRDVRKPVLSGALEFGEHFNVLVVVDLEIGQHQPARRLIDGEGFVETQDFSVEFARCGQVVGLEPDVGDAKDGRTRRAAGFGVGRSGSGLG